MKRKILFILVFFLAFSSLNNYSFAITLRPGDVSDEVQNIKEKLYDLGYNVSVNKVYDEKTEKAVKLYQKEAKLPITGIVDDITYQCLTLGRLTVIEKYKTFDLASIARQMDINSNPIIRTAVRFMGISYRWGGEAPSTGFDCSGFVQYVFRLNGINLPRTADLQYDAGKPISISELRPGDLVFFTTYLPGASHDGIYIGNGKFIAANTSTGVSICSLDDPYWKNRYFGAVRIQ
uniref:Glycoside hydrolase n=1 Tax=Thermodesulfobium narugense TaxID=184064 RepID=A0A7C5PB87_9BACT